MWVVEMIVRPPCESRASPEVEAKIKAEGFRRRPLLSVTQAPAARESNSYLNNVYMYIYIYIYIYTYILYTYDI